MKHYHPFGFEFRSFFLQMSHAFENGPPTLLLHAQKSKSKENVIIVHLLLKIQGVQATFAITNVSKYVPYMCLDALY